MGYSERQNMARATVSGSGYVRATGTANWAHYFGDCAWCGGDLCGKGGLAHLENGFSAETLDPTYGPAQLVCAGCHFQAAEYGRLRI